MQIAIIFTNAFLDTRNNILASIVCAFLHADSMPLLYIVRTLFNSSSNHNWVISFPFTDDKKQFRGRRYASRNFLKLEYLFVPPCKGWQGAGDVRVRSLKAVFQPKVTAVGGLVHQSPSLQRTARHSPHGSSEVPKHNQVPVAYNDK